MEVVQDWLATVPAVAVYVIVGVVIGLESLGIPLPGEIVLVSSALLAASPKSPVDPVAVGVCASTGAIIGDSIGYFVGYKGGRRLLARLGRRFPKHLGPDHVAAAERSFERWGMWAVFFGRFVALLRILAGPLAGVLRMPYWKFLIANVGGGILWAGGTTAAVYYAGVVAEKWLKGFSWVGLVIAVIFGFISIMVFKRRAARAAARIQAATDAANEAAGAAAKKAATEAANEAASEAANGAATAGADAAGAAPEARADAST